jgi:Protein of unknown function (DUF1628).
MADGSIEFGDDRGASTTVAVVVLCGLTVILGATVAGGLTGLSERAEPTPTAAVSLSVDDETLTLTHDHGDPLDVRSLRMVVAVDNEPLRHQPPVPFFSASGFDPGPTGPFNTASDPEWTVGESASLTLAGTNSPSIEPGSTVSVELYQDDTRIVTAETTAR